MTAMAERLGYAGDSRLLIVTSDDLGFTHSVNAAFMAAVDKGVLTSGSVMVPCPWFAEMAAFGRSRPDVDLGVHLTLTCECDGYRWGPVLGASAVPSLITGDGGFPVTEAEVLATARLDELEAELRAQVEVARAAGISPTHLDSHMGVLYQRPDVFEILLRIAADEVLPVRHPRTWARNLPFLDSTPPHVVVHNDDVRSAGQDLDADQWSAFYRQTISSLPLGVTELVLHVGYDDDELRAAYGSTEEWGAAWRQRDTDTACDREIADLIKSSNIVRIGWGALARLATDHG